MMQSPPAHDHHELEERDRGLVYDLGTLDRRRVLKLLGFGGLSAGLFSSSAARLMERPAVRAPGSW